MDAENITPARYYLELLPQQFAARKLERTGPEAQQATFAVTYELTGGGGIYSLRAQATRLDAVADSNASGDMWITMSLADWYEDIRLGALDTIVDYWYRRKVGIIKALKGTVRLELLHTDAHVLTSTTVFGGEPTPAVTLRLTSADYVAMTRGELSSHMALLTRKLKFEGDFLLLLQLGALNS